MQHLGSKVERPAQELRGFNRVRLEPNETRTVTFTLKASALANWDEARHQFTVEKDQVKVCLGASSADIKLEDSVEVEPAAIHR